MNPRGEIQILLFVTGLLSGILLESRVFHSRRAVSAAPVTAAMAATSSPATASTANVSGQPLLPTGAPRPVIRVESPTHDFGTAETGDKVEHTFLVQNAGTAPLVISQVRAACGCTTADVAGREVPPGGTTELKVVLDLRDRKGSQNSVVTLKSNDPEHGELKLSLVGSAVTRVTITPPMIDVGRVRLADSSAQGRARIQVAQGLDLKFVGISTSSPSLVAEFGEEADSARSILLSVNPGAEPGPLRGWVKIQTDHPSHYREISIPVAGYVGPGGPVIVGDELEILGPTLDGGSIDLKSLRGKVSVVVFWAGWCGHCQREMPELLALYKQLAPQGVEILGVNCDAKPEEARAAVEKWKLPWPNIHFPPDNSGLNSLMARLQVKGIPATFVVDRTGHVSHIGLRSPVLKVRLEQLLKSAEQASLTAN